VANKVAGDVELGLVRAGLGDLPLVAVLARDARVEAEARGQAPATSGPFHDGIQGLGRRLLAAEASEART
jgi:hypothetical protein